MATAADTAATSAKTTAWAPTESGRPNSLPATATPAAPLVQTVRATETRHVSSPIPLPMSRPRTPNAAPDAVALFVAVRDPRSTSGISRTIPTAVPTAIAEIVAHRPRPKVSPTQPKATAPRPTEPPMKMTKNVPGVEVRSPSGMRSTPLRSNPDGSKPPGSAPRWRPPARAGAGSSGNRAGSIPMGRVLPDSILRQSSDKR